MYESFSTETSLTLNLRVVSYNSGGLPQTLVNLTPLKYRYSHPVLTQIYGSLYK